MKFESLEVRQLLTAFGFSIHDIDSAQAAALPSMILADLNGDGSLDMLSKNVWRANDGNGSFGSTKLMFTGQLVDGLFAGDLDGDGDLDVVATGPENSTKDSPIILAWYENLDGRGSLSAAREIARYAGSINHYGRLIQGADLDGDGDLDLVSSRAGDFGLYENVDGKGTFEHKPMLPQGVYLQAIYDVDGDNDMDIIASVGNVMSLWENRGAEFIAHHLLNDSGTLVIEDVNHDGTLDFMLGGRKEPGLTWYEFNAESQTLAQREIIYPPITDGFSKIAAGDFDGDGDLDMAGLYFAASPSMIYRISVFELDGSEYGDEQFRAGESGPSNYSGLALEDVDGNGTADLVYVNAVEFYDAATQQLGKPVEFAPLSRQFYGTSIIADVDRDGDDDVISTDYTDYCYMSYDYCTKRLVWSENIDGRGNFVRRGELGHVKDFLDFQGAMSLAAGDIDQDGDLDVTFQLASQNEILWLEGLDRDGTFAQVEALLRGSLVDIVDVDGDGRDDLISFADNQLILDFKAGDMERQTVRLTGRPGSIALENVVVDWDGDGDFDVVALQTGNYIWYENLGSRTFAAARTIDASELEKLGGQRFFDDLDGDGDGDAIWTRGGGGGVVWSENLGGGMWGNAQRFDLPQTATQLIDMDRDGDLDVFDPHQRVWYERRALGDANGDGLFDSADLVAVFQSGQYDDWLTNNSVFDTGDFNGDGEFDADDLVAAFQLGTYVV
ncbi:MAG: VCBS repeat-containing protein [Planctomycetales bacterium]|nr:VCBS repeat-containing protein [Planctomycetales bacterium]